MLGKKRLPNGQSESGTARPKAGRLKKCFGNFGHAFGRELI
jgi:hypothetical protein